MANWDEDAQRKRFSAMAEREQIYLDSLPTKIAKTKNYEPMFDESLARWWLFYRLTGLACLASREQTVQELHSLLTMDGEIAAGVRAKDKERFRIHFQKEVTQLLNELNAG